MTRPELSPKDLDRPEQHRGHRPVSGGLARAAVFGINDGLVSNVSLILGFAGSGVDSSVVRLAGLAGAIAGGISMAAGEWISVSAQNELVEREVAVERRELARNTVAETAELAAIYEDHGISPETARAAADDVMASPEVALRVHTREELGVDPHDLPSAFNAAAISLVCFLFGALLPVIPWFTGASGFAPAAISVIDRRGGRGVRRCRHRATRRAFHSEVDRATGGHRAGRVCRHLQHWRVGRCQCLTTRDQRRPSATCSAPSSSHVRMTR